MWCRWLRKCRRCLCFFFQAEDGIRDTSVTGVQTCALPILRSRQFVDETRTQLILERFEPRARDRMHQPWLQVSSGRRARRRGEIGRASCRESVALWAVSGAVRVEAGVVGMGVVGMYPGLTP